MIGELIRIANQLDSMGLTKEADYLDAIIKEAKDCGSSADDSVVDDMENEAKTELYDEKMRESGFSEKQSENLPDHIQKEMLK